MKLTENQYAQIAGCFPRHRGNVGLGNLSVLNAVLYILTTGCKWRRLPKEFGNWHTVYTRMSRWTKAGVLDRVFRALQEEGFIRIKIEVISLDSAQPKAQLGPGALKKAGRKIPGNPREEAPVKFIWLPRMLNGLRLSR